MDYNPLMGLGELVIFLLIGLAAGWAAGFIMKRSGFGLLGNLIVGVLGALLGGFLAGLLQLKALGPIGEFLIALGGAIVLLFLLNIINQSSGKK